MKTLITTMSNIVAHIVKNLSNYTMLVGLLCVSSYVYFVNGFYSLLLFSGILLIIISILMEVNSSIKSK